MDPINTTQVAMYGALIAFLLLNLIISFSTKKSKTILDYALANRSVGTGALIITILATVADISYITIRIRHIAYDFGIHKFFMAYLDTVMLSLFLAYYIFPKMIRFKNCYTLGDIMGHIYGKPSQVFAGAIGIVVSMMFIVAQMVALGKAANYIGIEQEWIVLFGIALTIMFYMWWGGVRTVTATDMLQFVMLVVGMGTIAFFVLQKYNGLEGVWCSVKNEKPENLKVVRHPTFLLNFAYMFCNGLMFFMPPIIQRILMARNKKQVKQSFQGFAVFYVLLYFMITIIGLGLLIAVKGVKIKEGEELSQIYKSILGNTKWGNMLLMLILVAVTMSTLDSFLNGIAVVFVRDIVIPLKYVKPKKLSSEIGILRLITVVMVFLCTIMAYMVIVFKITPNNFIVMGKLCLGLPVVPFVLGVIGLKGSTKSFWYSIVSFSVVFLTIFIVAYTNSIDLNWLSPDREKVMTFRRRITFLYPLALFASLLGALIGHYIDNNGWFVVLRKKEKDTGIRPMHKKAPRFWSLLAKPINFTKDRIARYGSQPVLTGAFLSLSCMVQPLITQQTGTTYTGALLIVQFIGVLLCTGLMLHNRWVPSLRKYFPIFYFVTLLYCLPFSYMLAWLYYPANNSALLMLVLSIWLLSLLIDRQTAWLLNIVGWVLALVVYKATGGHYESHEFANVWIAGFAVCYTLLLTNVFVMRQEQVNTNRIERNKTWSSAFGHDLANTFQKMHNTMREKHFDDSVRNIIAHKFTKGEMNGEKVCILKEQDYRLLQSQYDQSVTYLDEAITQTSLFSDLVQNDHIRTGDIVDISMSKLLEKIHAGLPMDYQDKTKVQGSDDFTVQVHAGLIQNVFNNLVKNAFSHGDATEVTIDWDAEQGICYLRDNGTGIPAEKQPYIFDLYYTTGGQGVGLPFVKLVLEAMGATIDYRTSAKGTVFMISFARRV